MLSIDTTADTSAFGKFSYGAQYVPEGSGYAQSQSGCVDLEVTETCDVSGLSIAIAEASGSTPPYPNTTYVGGFVGEVQNCGTEDQSGVTAQGGSSGWTTFTGYDAETGTHAEIRKQQKNTVVTLWTFDENLIVGASKHLKVNVTGNIKANTPIDTVLYLSGPWTAKNGDGIKTPPTERVSITVVPAAP